MRVVTLDYETYYDDECTVETLGAMRYSEHPKFHAYLVAMVWGDSNDERWVGNPAQAPWYVLQGATAVAHNSLFEMCVSVRLVQDGIIPADCMPSEWRDTADLAAYFCLARRRNLPDTMKAFHVTMSKEIRAWAKGKTGDEIMSQRGEQMASYCLEDAEACWTVWKALGGAWPEKEQLVAELTKLAYLRGMHVDVPAIIEARKILKEKIESCKAAMPWVQAGRAPLSIQAFKEECESHNIPPPKSTDREDEDFIEFLAEYSEEYPWVKSMGELRKANRLDKILERVILRADCNSMVNIGLKYFGAHSGRWSGDEVNLQNLNKEPVFDINLRNIVVAGKGNVFVIFDYAQIEPRMLFWMVNDEAFLSQVRTGMSIYEAYARKAMGWKGGELKSENKKLYATAKASCLGSGYGMGASKFLKTQLPKAVVDDHIGPVSSKEEWTEKGTAFAKSLIDAFRQDNWKIPEFWREREDEFRRNIGCQIYECQLVSGRPFFYYRPREQRGTNPVTGRPTKELVASFYATEHSVNRLWGGTLTENYIQAIARDVVAEAVVRIFHETSEYPIFTSHDEVVYEVPESEAGDWFKYLQMELVVTPSWATGLPLGVEGLITKCYTK